MMSQTHTFRPQPFLLLGFLLMATCFLSVFSAKSQTEGNIYLPKDSLMREADSLWALALYEEAVPVYEKATWRVEKEDAEAFIAQKSASEQVQAAYLLGLLYRNNFRYFDLQKSVDQMIIAGKQRYKPALEMLADYYVNLKVSASQEAQVLSLLEDALAAGDTFLAEPLQQRKDFDQKLLQKPPRGKGCGGEEMAEFPGGEDSLSTFLRKEIHNVVSKDHPGTVLVEFVVEKDGSVREAKVRWSDAPEDREQEALRGVLLMPRWNPAHTPDRYMKCFFQVPITFERENEQELASGDLLFVHSKDSEMEKAISASTGEYTHVALVERDTNGYVWVIEANRQEGVRRIHFYEWEQEYADQYDVFRLTQPFDTADVISRAKRFLWKPYDEAFLPDNDKLYCSELIYECFWKDGEHLFEAKPMNWRDAEGNIPWYWIEHFQKLGVPVPEAVLGTNPTDMARSPMVRKVE